jgi:hypothetical protein
MMIEPPLSAGGMNWRVILERSENKYRGASGVLGIVAAIM